MNRAEIYYFSGTGNSLVVARDKAGKNGAKLIPVTSVIGKQVITKGWGSLASITSEKCDGCGICQKNCPVANITMVDHKPLWSTHCEGCFAFLH